MTYSREKSQPIFDRALNVLEKGVSSNFRYLGDHETPVIAKGKGAHDYVLYSVIPHISTVC
jgi:glutamate-1-semialdehyde aminotransferase